MESYNDLQDRNLKTQSVQITTRAKQNQFTEAGLQCLQY